MAISKIKDKQNTPASFPSSNSKQKSRDAVPQKEEKHSDEGGGRLNTGLDKAVGKKRRRRKEVNEKRVDLTGTFS